MTVQPISAANAETDAVALEKTVADFENGENPFPVIWNVYSGKAHASVDSQYIGLSAETEALNGNASLKLNIPSGNTRTEAAFAEPKLNNGNAVKKYITSASNASGIMLRLKINNDASTEGHNFAVLLLQGTAPANTHLAKDAVLYDLQGNTITSTSTSLSVIIPSGFDGFVYLPFASARANIDADANKYYDDYVNNPESMVDYTKDYSMTILFGKWGGGDSSWDNTEVLVDDICVIGSADGAVWDAMRACGYSDVLASAQPEKYTLPITHENLWQPISSVTATTNSAATDFTYTANASLTNNADEVLLGDISAKLSTETTYSGDAAGVIETLKTNSFTVAGIEALATDKITAENYAYLKMRIKAPTNENGNAYTFRTIFHSNNRYYFLSNRSGVAYNADGTENSSFAANAAKTDYIYLPSGFDGYIYLPIYRLRDTDVNNNNFGIAAFTTDTYTNPTLDQDFDILFYFKQNGYNLDNAEIIIDDLDFVFGDTFSEQLPFSFEDILYTRPTVNGKDESSWKVKDLSGTIGYTDDNEALNGKASLRIDVKGNYTESVYYNYNAVIFDNINPVTDTSIGGVMLRLKLLNDITTGTGTKAHGMQLVLVQSGCSDTCIGGTSTKLFDTDGKPLPSTDYATSKTTVYIPIGFDGFVFFPLSSKAHRTGSSELVDTTTTFSLQVWFTAPELWNGVSAVFDDISYYTVADSTVGLTETDAISAMNTLGYTTKWAEQPDAYDLSLDFEDYMLPFDTAISKYGQLNGDNKYPEITTDAQFVTGNEALSGNVSLKYSFIRDEATEAAGRKYIRALTSISSFNGIEGLDKESIANNAENYAYLTMRVKVPDTNESGYEFNVYAKQENNTKLPATRLRAEYGYTADGEYVEFKVSDGVSTLPAGFNGTIYMPIKNSTSTKVLTTGMRAKYGNSFTQADGTVLYGNDYMVDFSSEFIMYLYLGNAAWADTELYIDDILIKSFEASDFDNSGSTNALDILTLSRYILGVDTVQRDAFDLNKDGDIDVGDVVRIKRIIAGLVEGRRNRSEYK
ncbi:MAG: dockerin type I repeat-containing protein [Clostridia bacterium]|nr:dockerin type I repeat-containing protein [Clostridia bacterium]